MQSVMVHDFSKVPPAEIPRSQFDRSHGYKTTMQAGEIVPVYLDLAYPGDTFSLSVSAFGRLATPIKPIMDNIWMDFHFFAVPIRLLWSNWKRFMGEQANPTDSTDFLVPQITAPSGGFLTGGLADYFGFPVGVANISVSALPFRAYNLTWLEWYKDQNLQLSPIINKDDGPDDIAEYPILRRAKAHDYFTSCLPWAQKGADVLIPLGASAPVLPGSTEHTTTGDLRFRFRDVLGNQDNGKYLFLNTGYASIASSGGPAAPTTDQAVFPSNLYADLTAASAASVNAWREAFQLQRLLERDARSGSRLTEVIRAHFGVISEDFRQQRPEFLGSARANINMHPVQQTSPTASDPDTGYAKTPQGNLAAFGTLSVDGAGFTKTFNEHCVLLGLASVRTDQNYQNGVWAEWSYRDKYDFYWPALAHLGEKPVKNKEIYAQGTAADDETFGYQEAWAEARYACSKITGKFRSNETGGTPLDLWHLAQDPSTLPTLSSQFIIENPPMDRILAVPSEPHILLDCYFKIKAARPMPVYSVPGMIDHF